MRSKSRHSGRFERSGPPAQFFRHFLEQFLAQLLVNRRAHSCSSDAMLHAWRAIEHQCGHVLLDHIGELAAIALITREQALKWRCADVAMIVEANLKRGQLAS